MVKTTKPQRKALKRVWERVVKANESQWPYPARRIEPPYRQFRKTVQPGPGCIMVPFYGMWLGIEPDGYTHS